MDNIYSLLIIFYLKCILKIHIFFILNDKLFHCILTCILIHGSSLKKSVPNNYKIISTF